MNHEIESHLPISVWDEDLHLWVNIKAVETFKFLIEENQDQIEFKIICKDSNLGISTDKSVEKIIIRLLNKEIFFTNPLNIDSEIYWSAKENFTIGKIKKLFKQNEV